MYKFGLVAITLLLLISCGGGPEPSFAVGYANGEQNPTQLKFSNTTVGADSHLWYFGDDGTSTEDSPVHDFQIFGDVMVILEATKGMTSNRDTQYVNIPEPPRKKVRIETPMGIMVAELYNSTPAHRDNFLKLASEGFYDSLLFHRIMDNFMIQGGDPNSKGSDMEQRLGTGGPGYTTPAKIRELHYKGSLAAARQPDSVNPNKASSGSQFYIAEGKPYSSIELAKVGAQYGNTYNEEQKKIYANIGGTPFLDGQYSVFGRIIEGLEVIDTLSRVKVNSVNRPLKDVAMKITVIHE